MKQATATTVLVRASAPALDRPSAKALLNFPFRPYQPREAPAEPLVRQPVPQSIKDAIIHWLDEQL